MWGPLGVMLIKELTRSLLRECRAAWIYRCAQRVLITMLQEVSPSPQQVLQRNLTQVLAQLPGTAETYLFLPARDPLTQLREGHGKSPHPCTGLHTSGGRELTPFPATLSEGTHD